MKILMDIRGFRNNNPGNIRHGCDWEGLSEKQPDPSFCTFESIEYGIRAIYKILETYKNKYKLNNIHGIINRWAPPNENDTDSYVNSVEQRTNLDYDATLYSGDYPKIVEAIIFHENGIQPYKMPFIESCQNI